MWRQVVAPAYKIKHHGLYYMYSNIDSLWQKNLSATGLSHENLFSVKYYYMYMYVQTKIDNFSWTGMKFYLTCADCTKKVYNYLSSYGTKFRFIIWCWIEYEHYIFFSHKSGNWYFLFDFKSILRLECSIYLLKAIFNT